MRSTSIIGKRALRETDLLAFQIGIGIGDPGAVMCSYNAINGDYACQNKYLLTDVLKKDWGFKGFVVSDWGGTHSTVKASAAGLDNEQPHGRLLRRKAQAGGRGRHSSHGANWTSMCIASCAPSFAAGLVDYPDAEERGRCGRRLCHLAPHRRAEHRSAQEPDRLLPLDRATRCTPSRSSGRTRTRA